MGSAGEGLDDREGGCECLSLRAVGKQEATTKEQQRRNCEEDRAYKDADEPKQKECVGGRNQRAKENKLPSTRHPTAYHKCQTQDDKVKRDHQPQRFEAADEQGTRATFLEGVRNAGVTRTMQQGCAKEC